MKQARRYVDELVARVADNVWIRAINALWIGGFVLIFFFAAAGGPKSVLEGAAMVLLIAVPAYAYVRKWVMPLGRSRVQRQMAWGIVILLWFVCAVLLVR